MNELIMKDIFGNILAIGDIVAFNRPRYRGLTTGKIVAFTPKNVRVEYGNSAARGAFGNIPYTYLTDSIDLVKKIDV